MGKGKKGKYHEWVTKDGLVKIEGWARDGLTDEQIAHNIGIVTSTLYEWKKKHASISEALKNGKEVIDRQVENALLRRALGYEYEEVKTYIEKDGTGKEKKKVEKTTKHVSPDTTAQIFWLRNRTSKWGNKDLIDKERAKAEIEFTKERTKLLKGELKDTTMLDSLINAIKGDA